MCTEKQGKFMKTNIAMIISTALFSYAGVATAQEAGVITTESGIDFVPAFTSTLKHDDNVARSNVNEISSWVGVLTPSLKAMIADGADVYTLSGALTNGRYYSSEADNFTDGYLQAEAVISPSSRDNFKFSLNNRWLHEERGTGITQGNGLVQTEVVNFIDRTPEIQNINTALPVRQVRCGSIPACITKNIQTSVTARNIVISIRCCLVPVCLYQLPSAFKAVTEINSADIIYQLVDPTGGRDNRDTNYRLGVEWAFTTVSVGALKLGYQDEKL